MPRVKSIVTSDKHLPSSGQAGKLVKGKCRKSKCSRGNKGCNSNNADHKGAVGSAPEDASPKAQLKASPKSKAQPKSKKLPRPQDKSSKSGTAASLATSASPNIAPATLLTFFLRDGSAVPHLAPTSAGVEQALEETQASRWLNLHNVVYFQPAS